MCVSLSLFVFLSVSLSIYVSDILHTHTHRADSQLSSKESELVFLKNEFESLQHSYQEATHKLESASNTAQLTLTMKLRIEEMNEQIVELQDERFVCGCVSVVWDRCVRCCLYM